MSILEELINQDDGESFFKDFYSDEGFPSQKLFNYVLMIQVFAVLFESLLKLSVLDLFLNDFFYIFM